MNKETPFLKYRDLGGFCFRGIFLVFLWKEKQVDVFTGIVICNLLKFQCMAKSVT